MSEEVPVTMEERIRHCLEIYPLISPSMLQVGIGTHFPSTEWKPVLRDLVDRGVVEEEEFHTKTPVGRNFYYTRLTLVQ